MIYRGGGMAGQGTIPGGPLGKAKYALSIGRADEAEKICRKRLERSPDDTSARVLLAQALLAQNMSVEAAEEARRAIREQPTNVDANLILSSASLQRANLRGVPAEAESAARRAVQLAPKASKTHVQLAEVLAAKKDFKGARDEADEAIKLEPRLAGAHLIKAIVLLTDKDPQGAIQSSDNALRYDRTLTQAEFIKANAYMDTKQYDEALSSLDTVDRNAGGMIADPQRQMLRGRIFFKQRKFKQSYGRFLYLQRMNPRFRFLAPTLAGLSMVLFGVFGTGGQYALIALFVLIVLAILFGLSFIPVVGGWIVAVIALALIGVMAFGAVKQSRGRIFPAEMSARLMTVVGAVMLFAVGMAITLWVANAFSKHGWFNPFTFGLGGMIGLILSAVGIYLLSRFGGRTAAA